jgi:hypothetical protein
MDIRAGKRPKINDKARPGAGHPNRSFGTVSKRQRQENWRAGASVLLIQLPGTRPATYFRLRKGFAMPDVVDFKPVRARRPHRSVRPKLLNIKWLDRRTAARKAFDALVAEIEHDIANAVVGVAAALTTDRGAAYLEFCRRFNGSTDADPDGVEAWRHLRDFAYVSTGGAVRLW